MDSFSGSIPGNSLRRKGRILSEPVHVPSFRSARSIAVAFSRDPALFGKKTARIHLCAGGTAAGFLEWNEALDRYAFVGLLRSQLPIALLANANWDNDMHAV